MSVSAGAATTMDERMRVTERPAETPVMVQMWRDLGFLHWPVDAEAVGRVLPPGLEVDTYDGLAYVGIVPFTIPTTRAMGAVPIVVAVVMKSQASDRPLKGFWVRKEVKDHGIVKAVDGDLADGAKVVIVEDVTTTGGSAMKAVEEAKKKHCEIKTVITVIDRLEGAKENLAKQGIELISLFTTEDFLG